MELIYDSFQNGFEAILTMGIIAIGIYLAWIVLPSEIRTPL